MRAFSTVWLIQRGNVAQPAAEFVHEVAHFTLGWSTDRTRARRFKSKAEAERFGANLLAAPFHATEHALRDLVRTADARSMAGEVEELVPL